MGFNSAFKGLNNVKCKEEGNQRPVGQVGKILSQEFLLLCFCFITQDPFSYRHTEHGSLSHRKPHPPGYPSIAVFMTAIKETHSIFNTHIHELNKMIFFWSSRVTLMSRYDAGCTRKQTLPCRHSQHAN